MSTHPSIPACPVDHARATGGHEKQQRIPRPSEVATCRCGAKWTGLAVAHCGACHQTFAGPSLFDRHRHARGEFGGCDDPNLLVTKLGKRLMFYRNGMWRSPEMPEEVKALRRAAGNA